MSFLRAGSVKIALGRRVRSAPFTWMLAPGQQPQPLENDSLTALTPGNRKMQKPEKVDLTKLLGFETVTNEPTDDIDFQDETLSAKLGAKVGSIIEATEPGR